MTVMNDLKASVKYYLIYFLIFLLGASLAAGVRHAYDFNIVLTLAEKAGTEASFSGYALFIADILKPIILIFLASFTIYSCAVGGAASVYTGCKFGIFVYTYVTSDLNVFTHPAVTVFFLIFAGMYMWLSTNAAVYRNTLKSTAPETREIIKSKHTAAIFYNFLIISAITLALSTALYFFLIYFPV